MALWTRSWLSCDRFCTSTSCVGRLTPRSLQPMDVPICLASSRMNLVSSGENIWTACTHEARPPQGPDFLGASAWNWMVVDMVGTKVAARTRPF